MSPSITSWWEELDPGATRGSPGSRHYPSLRDRLLLVRFELIDCFSNQNYKVRLDYLFPALEKVGEGHKRVDRTQLGLCF